MGVNEKWTVQMKNNINGIMRPQIDCFDKSVFYVSDGLFSTYSGMRFRKMSVETGEELANVLTRDGTRCIYCDREYVYAFFGKRILKLHKSDLTVANAYKEKIPRYTDYVASDGADIFLLANWNADSLSIFDLQAGRTIHRKKIGGCCGIFKTGTDSFLIFNYDSILEYSLSGNKLNKIADTERYEECVRGNSGRAYLLCGGVHYSGSEITSADYKILIYSFVPETRLEKVIYIPEEILGHLCSSMTFQLSKDEKWLYLFDSVSIWIYSVYENQIIFQYTFQSEYIQNIFAEKSFVITQITLPEPQKEHKVSGWEIEI